MRGAVEMDAGSEHPVERTDATMGTREGTMHAVTNADEPDDPFITEAERRILERFDPVFAQIKASAVRRELDEVQAHAEVGALVERGFGALTVPADAGGSGLDARGLLVVLTELARADSNVAHALRSHFLTVEGALVVPGEESAWVFEQAAAGKVIGTAGNEKGSAGAGITSRLLRDGDEEILEGVSYYTTGSLFADWIRTYAFDDSDRRVSAVVGREQEGVEVRSDYGGFGQRWSGSGTTEFHRVAVTGRVTISEDGVSGLLPVSRAFAQLILLAVVVGAGKAALDDVVELLRRRTYNHPSASDPRPLRDPIISEIVGEVSAAVFAAQSALHAAAAAYERTRRAVGKSSDRLDSEGTRRLIVASDLATFRAQAVILPGILAATSSIFDVAGATAVERSLALDRHWRNVRTVASHNPVRFRLREIGAHHLNGGDLEYGWGRQRASGGGEARPADV